MQTEKTFGLKRMLKSALCLCVCLAMTLVGFPFSVIAAEIIRSDFDQKNLLLSFKTDSFSTYAIMYKDTTQRHLSPKQALQRFAAVRLSH